MMNVDNELDQYAFHCFRDVADRDYVAARLSFRSQLMPQFFWLGLQAIEKYTKCILLLYRVRSNDIGHDIRKGILKVAEIEGAFPFITEQSLTFARVLYEFGRHRYLEKGYNAHSQQIIFLDQLVAEIRRCCVKPASEINQNYRFIRLTNGVLEAIIDDKSNPARTGLVWKNAFFGNSRRNKVALPIFEIAERPSAAYHPKLVEELSKYILIPKDVRKFYRDATAQNYRTLSAR